MKEHRIIWKKQHLTEKRESMKRRDDHHDYFERRMYMITIEVEGRYPLFGRLEGDVSAPPLSSEAPHIVLSELGRAVRAEWMGISRYYPQIEVKAVQMMPDHLHGILFVRERLPVHLGQVISGFKAGCRKIQRRLAAAEPQPTGKALPPASPPSSSVSPSSLVSPASPLVSAPPSSLSSPSPALPSSPQVSSSPQASAPPSSLSSVSPLPSLFARGYNDLILRSFDELGTWMNYLRDNPRRLMMKRTHPDWLRPFFGLQIGEYTFNGIGNRALLDAPLRMAVRLSRRLPADEQERTVRMYLEAAKKGAVLVSPAISPGEKRTMREAFNAGYPTIVILENGFTPFSKPSGERFYACAQGRLLMLSAWEHHNDKRLITANQCQQMNLMALTLCQHR